MGGTSVQPIGPSGSQSPGHERLKAQLCIATNELLRPFYDLVVTEVAITGSDLFLREGSDVTLLFRVQQRSRVPQQMDQLLKKRG